MRALGVRMKLNPLRENIDGRRLVVVDDSIVRGTTTKAMAMPTVMSKQTAMEENSRLLRMLPTVRSWPRAAM